MTHVGLLLTLPKPYTILQFSYRLEGYVLIGVTAAVLVVLVITPIGFVAIRGLVVGPSSRYSLVSTVGAVQQVERLSAHGSPAKRRYSDGRGEIFAVVFKDYWLRARCRS